ncbi:hypothetical protein ACEPAH_7781 [Sanghuangporus vaninii]
MLPDEISRRETVSTRTQTILEAQSSETLADSVYGGEISCAKWNQSGLGNDVSLTTTQQDSLARNTTRVYWERIKYVVAEHTDHCSQVSLTKRTKIDALKIQQRQIPPVKYRDFIITNNEYPLGSKDDVVPCSDCAGEVLACGSAVKGLTCDRYRAFPAHSLVKILDYLTFEEASKLPSVRCESTDGLMDLWIPDAQLSLCSGVVLVFALQIARANGANVIATTASVEKGKILKELGAMHVIKYKETTKWDEDVLRLINGRGVDHVVEVAGAGTILQSINAVRISAPCIGFLTHAQGTPSSEVLGGLLGKAVRLRAIVFGSKNHAFENMSQYHEALTYLASQQHVGKMVVKIAQNY